MDKKDGKIYYYYSEEAAEDFGYIIAFLDDKTQFKFTLQTPYVDTTYNYNDKFLVYQVHESEKDSKIISYDYSNNTGRYSSQYDEVMYYNNDLGGEYYDNMIEKRVLNPMSPLSVRIYDKNENNLTDLKKIVMPVVPGDAEKIKPLENDTKETTRIDQITNSIQELRNKIFDKIKNLNNGKNNP